jgi:hypothetical protein
MSCTAHHEVISVLTELYTLLDTLAAIPPNTLRLPPTDTGIHPTFSADAASEGGYSLEAVEALSALPYVYGGAIIGPSTSTHYFLRTKDSEDFEQDREMMYDDNLAPPSAIQLTDSEGGYGCIYVYDAEKSPQHESSHHHRSSKLIITLRSHISVDANGRSASRL